MKRLSALAQLVAMYGRHEGVTTTTELAQLTGRTERQIWRAKAELGDVCDTDKDVSHPDVYVRLGPDINVTDPDANVSADPDANVSAGNPHPSPSSPKRKVSPCTPSKENNPTIPILTPQNLPSVDSAPAAAAKNSEVSAGRVYAFEGDLIRLLDRDVVKFRKDYPAIADLEAQLRLADAYYFERPEKLDAGKWWFPLKKWLERANTERLEAQKAAQQEAEKLAKDPYYASMFRLGMSREKYERIYPPEIYRGLS